MEGTALIPGLYASTNEKKKYKSIFLSAVFLDGLFTMILSTLSYQAYGSNTRDIVIMNLSYGLLSNVVQMSYAVGVLCTFALQLFPLLEIIESK